MEEFITRQEHTEFAKRMEADHKRFDARLKIQEEQGKQNTQLLVAVERLATSMENMQKEQKEQGDRLEVLEARDGEMWRKAVGYLVTAIIGGVIGYIFKQVGM